MSDWYLELTPWPFRSQLTNLTADGQPSENSANDCGMTVVAEVIEYLTGVRFYPDIVNDLMYWEGHVGKTDAPHVTSFLSQFASTNTTVLNPMGTTGQGSLTNVIWAYLRAGKPLIALRQYSTTANFLHWVAVMGLDPTYVHFADPFTGTRKTETYADFATLYRHSLIGIERVRDSHL